MPIGDTIFPFDYIVPSGVPDNAGWDERYFQEPPAVREWIMTTDLPMFAPPDLSRKVGIVLYDATSEVDAILAASVALLRARGITVGGLLQRSGERLSSGRPVMWADAKKGLSN